MVSDILVILALFSSFTAIGAVVVCAFWLKKLRRALAQALNDAATQQITTAQRLGEALTTIQRQQKMFEQQLHNLAQANSRVRQDITAVAQRVERGEAAARADVAADRILH
jgi:DUF917 family protein